MDDTFCYLQAGKKSKSCTVTKPKLFAVPSWEDKKFIHRPIKARALLELLLKGSGGLVGITGLKGAGGFGKTQLALWLCHQPDVWAAFPDGILWVTLGEAPTHIVSLLDDIITKLTGQRPGFHDLYQAIIAFNNSLSYKQVLLVIDDVWSLTALEPLLNGGPRCVRLITTRYDGCLPADTARVTVEEMEEGEAVSLLTMDLEISLYDPKWHYFACRRLGRWALLLSLVNARMLHDVREGLTPTKALIQVSEELTEVGLNACNRDAQARHLCVDACIQANLKILPPQVVQCFYDLAIFPEDTSIPLTVLEKFWSGLSPVETRRTCQVLKDASLLHSYDLTQKTIRLHDVMRIWLREKSREVNDRLERINSRFVDVFGFTGKWEKMPSDGASRYLWEWLGWHLLEARRSQDVLNLAKNIVWLGRKSVIVGVRAMEADIVSARQVAPQDWQLELLERRLWAYAHLLASCIEGREAVAVLHGRLCFEEMLRPLLAEFEKIPYASPTFLPFHPLPDAPDPALVRVFIGHKDSVECCTFSHDGRLALSGSRDGTVRLWDAVTGNEVFVFIGHSDRVFYVDFSPDDQLARSASYDKTIRLWGVSTGKVVDVIADDMEWLGDVEDYEPNHQLHIRTDWHDNNILIMHDITNNKFSKLEGHSDRVTHVVISPDGQMILSASDDKAIYLWDVKTSKKINTFTGHSDKINSMSFSSNGQLVLSASDDRTVRLWNMTTGKEICVFAGHSGCVNDIAFSHNDQFILSASADGTVRLWDVSMVRNISIFEEHLGSVFRVVFSPDGQLAISASYDGTVRLWNVATGREIRVVEGSSDDITLSAFNPDGQLFLFADGVLCQQDVTSGKEIRVFEQCSRFIADIDISRDGKLAILASYDQTVRLWSITTGREVRVFKGHLGWVTCATFSPNGQLAISASVDKTIRMWEVSTGKEVNVFVGHLEWVTSVAFSPDGQWILSASKDRTVRIWSVAKGREVRIIDGHFGWVTCAVFSPDGQWILSASRDRTVRLWELISGECLAVFHGDGEMAGCSFHPDGRYIVAGGKMGVYFLEIHGLPDHPHLEQIP